MDTNGYERRGQSIASMVTGILSLVLSFVPYLGAGLALAAVVLAGIALNGTSARDPQYDGTRGMAIAGLVTGICGLVIGLALTLGVACLCSMVPMITVRL